jgi:hypothetical protein
MIAFDPFSSVDPGTLAPRISQRYYIAAHVHSIPDRPRVRHQACFLREESDMTDGRKKTRTSGLFPEREESHIIAHVPSIRNRGRTRLSKFVVGAFRVHCFTVDRDAERNKGRPDLSEAIEIWRQNHW